MSDTKKNIAVRFVKFEQDEKHPDTIGFLGNISDDERIKIMDAFSAHTPAANACIPHMTLDFQDKTYYGHAPWNYDRYPFLYLYSMFRLTNKMPKCGKQDCKLDEEAKIKRCARNLKNGKCQDEFMRNTLGAILYPQHYAKDKQK